MVVTSAEPVYNDAFISYRRADLPLIEPLLEELRDQGASLWVDTTDIEAGTKWWSEIENSIRSSSSVVCMLSPGFLDSEVCQNELTYAHDSGKRIIPVVVQEVSPSDPRIPAFVAEISWIVDDEGDTPADRADQIIEVARSNPDWIREHSRLLNAAHDWEANGKPRSRLLKSKDIAAAESMMTASRSVGDVQPTDLQGDYVAASRRSRSRLLGGAFVTVSLVSVLSLGLAAFAFQQRGEAVDQKTIAETQEAIAVEQRDLAAAAEQQSLQALARSDFERLAALTEGDTTRQVAVQASLAASALADEDGQFQDRAHVALLASLANRDRPIAEFVAQADDQGASGGNQGVDVSRDGSTLAIADPTGGVRVVDLWTMTTIHEINPPESSGFGVQLALAADGARLARVVSIYDGSNLLSDEDSSISAESRVFSTALEPNPLFQFRAEVEVFELGQTRSESVSIRTVALHDAATAVAYGPTTRDLAIIEESLVVTVIDPEGADSQTTSRLGSPVQRFNADFYEVHVSTDGNRICTTAGSYFQIDPPMLIERFGTSVDCVPEPCGGDSRNMYAIVDRALDCLAPGGATISRDAVCGPCTRTFGDVVIDDTSALDIPQPGVLVPGPFGAQRVVVGDGRVTVYDNESSGLPAIRTVTPSERMQAFAVTPEGEAFLTSEDGELWRTESAGSSLVPAGEPAINSAAVDGAVGTDGTLYWREGDEIMRLADADTSATTIAVSDGTTGVAFGGGFAFVRGEDSLLRVSLDGSGTSADVAIPDGPCASSVSQNDRFLAVVSCRRSGDGAALHVADLSAEEGGPSLIAALPLTNPAEVAVADDAETFAVANGAGQIAVYHNGEFIQPPSLLAEPIQTNDFQAGWIALAPEGDFVVTRRNAEGFRLWAINEGSMTYVGALTGGNIDDLLFAAPRAGFNGDRLTIASSPAYTADTGFVSSWEIGYDETLRRVCAEWTAQPGDSALEDLTTYEPDCNSRGVTPQPGMVADVEPPVVEDSNPSWTIDEVDAFTFGSFDSSSDVLLDRDGQVVVTGLGAENTNFIASFGSDSDQARVAQSPGSLARTPLADGSGGYWFARSSASGDGLDIVRVDAELEQKEPQRPELINRPRAFSVSGSTVWSAADGSVVQSVDGGGGTLIFPEVGGPEEVRWSRAASWGFEGPPITSAAFVGSAPSGSSALLTLGPDGSPTYREFGEQNDVVAIAPDGTVWLTKNRSVGGSDSTSSVLRYVNPDGQSGTLLVNGHLIENIVVDDLGDVWFTSGSAVGRIASNGDVWSNEVHGARFLNGIAVDRSSSTLWLSGIDAGVLRLRYTDRDLPAEPDLESE